NWHSTYPSILDYSVTSFSVNTYLVDIRSQKKLLFPAHQSIVLVKTKNEKYYVFKDILFKRLEK
ncbi:MAG: hypothetical protein PHS65_09325, partial [Arcobacteraceae bacterium]|nr:hypothetical protein [Arcobacteraceae bacterium]